MHKAIKLILAVLLFLCLAEMPYGYFQFVRFAAMIVFGLLVYKAIEAGNKTSLIIYGTLALLFQPFLKIALGRELWNIVDVIVGIGLILSIFSSQQKSNN